MIIRELIASLGISFDKRGADQADARIAGAKRSLDGLEARGKGVASSLSSVFSGIALGGAWLGLRDMVDEAANADDYMNVLRETFKENADGVVAWSVTTAAAMSRSEFEMRKMTGTFGSFLTPMLNGNREMSAEMSKTLSELSVDLSSFYADLSDDQAMEKLFSGMAGETEAVRRLGIDLTEAGLKEFARAQGITKSYKAMTAAEKTQVRYKKILADTTDKQGDAIRTAATYENRVKALKASFQTLSVAVGGQFVHALEDALGWLRDGVVWMQSMVETSNIAKGVIVGLSVATFMLALSLWSVYAPLIPIVAGFAILAVAVDDVLTLFEGGDSVIGDFIDSIAGQKGAHVQIIKDIKQAWTDLGPAIKGAAGLATFELKLMYHTAKLLLGVLTSIGEIIGNTAATTTGTGERWEGVKSLLSGDLSGYADHMRKGRDQNTAQFSTTYAAPGKQMYNPPPALPTVPGRGAYDTYKAAGVVGDNLAVSGTTGPVNYTINLNGPQSRDTIDYAANTARRLAESARVR